jgi:DNA replication ATP-dependent helicase Dna2
MKANPNLFFLSLLEGSEPSTAILRGKLINDYFDALIANPALDEQEYFDSFIRQNVLETLPFDIQKVFRIGGEVLQFIRPILEDFVLKYRDYDCLTEPTFYSEKYGLLGRLDLLIQDENKKDIIELKSGKPPKKFTWANNRMQVIGYNLLLESTFENRQGNSSIFYCRAEEEPVRNVYASEALEQQFLMVRNFIITKLFDIAEGKESLFSLCASDKFGHYPPFKAKFMELLKQLKNRMSREEKSYVDEFSKFVLREIITAKIGSTGLREKQNYGFSKLWRLPLEDKKSSSFQQLKLQSIGFSRVVLQRPSDETIVNIREGDIILLYKENCHPLRQQIFRGMIENLEQDEITVKLWNHQIEETWFSKEDYWVLENDFMEQNLTVLLQTFIPFLKASSEKRDLLLGFQAPDFQYVNYEGDELTTQKQKHIISQALSAKDYLLIQGPPGTGKTSAILKNIVSELYYNPENKDTIFVLAYTNRAVEEISEKLHQADIRFIRLGRGESRESIYELSHQYEFLELRTLLQDTKVFVSTVASFQGNFSTIAQVYPLDIVIVDEASQLIEPHLIGILSSFKKFIMIGDHKQLPAVVLQNETKIHSEILQQVGFQDFKEPIFERLWQQMEAYDNTDAILTLSEHFRMHQDIASLINPFYSNQLEPFTDRQFAGLEDDFENLNSRVIFIEIPTDTRTNFSHLYEAEMICRVVQKLRKKYKEKDIGIVTPWRTQIALIRKELKKIGEENIYIDTVERFQGSEKEVILFSFALNHPQQISLMQTLDRSRTIDRKLNVAISRAKERLILFGDSKILAKNKIFSDLMRKIKTDFLWLKEIE